MPKTASRKSKTISPLTQNLPAKEYDEILTRKVFLGFYNFARDDKHCHMHVHTFLKAKQKNTSTKLIEDAHATALLHMCKMFIQIAKRPQYAEDFLEECERKNLHPKGLRQIPIVLAKLYLQKNRNVASRYGQAIRLLVLLNQSTAKKVRESFCCKDGLRGFVAKHHNLISTGAARKKKPVLLWSDPMISKLQSLSANKTKVHLVLAPSGSSFKVINVREQAS